MTNYFTLLNEWHWISLGVSLVIFEVLLGTSFFLLWLGLCAISMSILVWLAPSLPWEYQLLIFGVISSGSIFLWQRYLKNNPIKTDHPRLNKRNEQYVGRTFTLHESIENGRGKIRVDDSSWIVEGPDLQSGNKVKVIGVNGVILQVEKSLSN